MTVAGRLRLGAMIIVLLSTAYNGVVEGGNAVQSASTAAQWVATISQIAYGLTSMAALVGMILGARWVTGVLVVWGAACIATAAAAPGGWADAPVVTGVESALVAGAVVGLVVWGWRAHERARPGAPRPAAER